MNGYTGKAWLERLRKRWIVLSAVQVLLYALSFAIIMAALLNYLLGVQAIGFILTFFISFLILSLITKYWKISLIQVSRYVDQKFPEVEDSSGLLLMAPDGMSFLQQLQLEKVNKAISNQQMPKEPVIQLRNPALFLLFSIGCFYLITLVPARKDLSSPAALQQSIPPAVVKETVPAEISDYKLTIVPPGYTSRALRSQKQLTLSAEDGSNVRWSIETSLPIKKLSLIWNDSEVTPLKKSDESGTTWTYSRVMNKPGFYQVVLDGKKSDFYQVEIIHDQPVAIKITNPIQHTTIDFGQPQLVNLKVLMTDDYGISSAYISATMASGKGEAVNFKEQKINLNTAFHNQKTINVSQQLSLSKMGLKPGDELYFFINATDNHGQQSRSEMYFVSIQDTTDLMSLSGIDNGVNLVPEYFRSQRQIIIDTEKLLKERTSIPDADFKKRSNDLGIDQKMLRLRYGKFLGEEEETNIGGGHEEHEGEADGKGHDEHKPEPAVYGDVKSLMDQYAHKHDQAEDATFFEPEMKAQLKATLNEMWTAELRLRTYDPQKALPFEYKALRLLKDLQQKSRAYVAKTTFTTSALKPEKRLTGELAEVQETAAISKNASAANQVSSLKACLALLENRKSGQKGTAKDLKTLRVAEQELVNAAASSPAQYLPALKAMKKVMAAWSGDSIAISDLSIAEKGINSRIGKELTKPFKSPGNTNDLSKAYFNQLKRTQR
jgi:hypothetical protein